MREDFRKDAFAREHTRHLALHENPAVEGAEAADEGEERQQLRGAVAPEEAQRIGERRIRLRELLAGNQQHARSSTQPRR